MPKTIKASRSVVIVLLCAGLALTPLPRASAASLAEYGLLLALIAITLVTADHADLPPGSKVVVGQLDTAVEGARAASIVGNSTAEFARLSKALGGAHALMGMAAACADCGDFRSTVQQIIGQIALFRARIAGVTPTCNPNGIVQPNEQCDPLAIPSGCPTTRSGATYCSDECTCELEIVP